LSQFIVTSDFCHHPLIFSSVAMNKYLMKIDDVLSMFHDHGIDGEAKDKYP